MRIDELIPAQFVIAGTDTAIGKTLVASILAAGLSPWYWKPIQSGLDERTDSETVGTLSGLPRHRILPEAYRLKCPLSPHASAALDGIVIDPERLRLPSVTGRLIVEGAGGLMVPIDDRTLLIDVIKAWGLSVLLVAGTRLGTINHTLLSLQALRLYGIDIVGVVLNGKPDTISRQAIELYGRTKILAEIPPLSTITTETISDAFKRCFGGEEY